MIENHNERIRLRNVGTMTGSVQDIAAGVVDHRMVNGIVEIPSVLVRGTER